MKRNLLVLVDWKHVLMDVAHNVERVLLVAIGKHQVRVSNNKRKFQGLMTSGEKSAGSFDEINRV